MSRLEKNFVGGMALAQILHFVAFVALWSGWFSHQTLQISFAILLLSGWNLVMAVQTTRRFPWVEPLASAYAMTSALRLLVFTCAIFLPLIQRHTPPNHWAPFYLLLLTTLLMQGFGFATLVRIPRQYARG